jgi:hypothetical protein
VVGALEGLPPVGELAFFGVLADVGYARLRDAQQLERAHPYSAFATTPLPEVGDLRLLRHDRIVCAGGEHRRSVSR